MGMMRICCLMGVAIVAAAPTVVTAWQFDEDAATGNCRVGEIFEGEGSTIFFFQQNQSQFEEDAVEVTIGNGNWSIENGDDLGRIRFENEDGAWFESDAIGVATEDYGALFLTTTFEYFDNVMSGYPTSLIVTRNGSIVDRLSLAGINYDYSRFKRCRDQKVAVVGERERKERLKNSIPRDPFSN